MAATKNKKVPKPNKDIDVAVAEVVDYLRVTGAFPQALAQVVERKVAAQAARQAGLRVSTTELQKAADAFRSRVGLNKASDTEKWLKAAGLTIDTLENHLETDILIGKLKRQIGQSASKRIAQSDAVKATVTEMAYREWMSSALSAFE